jgi:hypothetical protein
MKAMKAIRIRMTEQRATRQIMRKFGRRKPVKVVSKEFRRCV